MTERALVLGAAFILAIVGGSKFEPRQKVQPRQDEETWQHWLPQEVRSSILWVADHEEGTLFDWENDRNPDNNGGGVFTTGPADEALAEAVKSKPFTGAFCAKTSIHGAFKSKSGNRAVRLMRWTDKPWDQGGKFFPDSAYYGVWMRLDEAYSIENDDSESGGWWNVFQFKSNDRLGESQPVWVLNIGNILKTGQMQFYLYSKQNKPHSVGQTKPVPIPVGRWFHLEVFYEQSATDEGNISVWQDGELILAAKQVRTVMADNAVWGIGNYTDHITGGDKPGSATVYFDDATISTKPTHAHSTEMLKRRR